MVTMDVESLYTNILHQEGMEALQHYLQVRPVETVPLTDFVVQLTDWTLKNNVFLLQDRLYQQRKGTAMPIYSLDALKNSPFFPLPTLFLTK